MNEGNLGTYNNNIPRQKLTPFWVFYKWYLHYTMLHTQTKLNFLPRVIEQNNFSLTFLSMQQNCFCLFMYPAVLTGGI